MKDTNKMTAKEFWNLISKVGYERNDYERLVNLISIHLSNEADEWEKRAELKEKPFDAKACKSIATTLQKKATLLHSDLKDRGYYEL